MRNNIFTINFYKMVNHIKRLHGVGLGPETTAGTAVNAAVWIPVQDPSVVPELQTVKDESAYGVIDAVSDIKTVENRTKAEFGGILRDTWIGYLLRGALGTHLSCQIITITGQSGGTPARGDAVSSSSSSWSGVIRKIFTVGANTYYAVSTTSGTLSGTPTDLTNGTWTGGTVAIKTSVKGHFFSRLNTNNHPTFTIYNSSPVSDERAAYGMIETLDIEVMIREYAKFSCSMLAKKLSSVSAQSPSYTQDNVFLAKYATMKVASNEAGLNAATAIVVEGFKMTIAKNLETVQAFGSDDVDSIHNKQFGVAGEINALFTDATMLDYVRNSTHKAARIALINNEVTALQSDIYPSIYIDFAELGFSEWSQDGGSNDLVRQTLGFEAIFKATDAMAMEVLLLNSSSSTYA